MAISLLLLRRLSLSPPNPTLSRLFAIAKTFSTSPSPSSPSSSLPDSGPPSSLSARMSFVFDQIDAIERERSEKDDTLQRIRAWRQAKNAQSPGLDSELSKRVETEASSAESETREAEPERHVEAQAKNELELVHPWPEWIELMERLVQQNYFDHRRKDEDKMIHDLGFDSSVSGNSRVSDFRGLDFNNFKFVQTACLNFGKDRFDILRSLSRQDIQLLVGFGCPSADRKVVFSSKLLRKHVHLDEGDVCSSCSLRNSCDRAYLLTLKEEEARTIDIMRVLLAYGFDPLNDTALNQSLLKQKSVKTVVRKLLHQVVKLSSVPIDPNLPPPIIKKPPPKVKIPPPPPKKRVGRDDIEMKKGDWLCPKCDFMNFAKNTVCLQCDAKRPKRELLPGEWECPQCNFLNYRRNTVCFHCECKRPPDEFTERKMQEKQEGPRVRMEKTIDRSEVSNAWNFDFDDDESDGADVAAFEYADSSVVAKGSLDNQAEGRKFGETEFDYNKTSRDARVRDMEYSDTDNTRPNVGFDDFADEEDDVDNYEIDTGNRSSVRMISPNDLSEFEADSGSEDNGATDNNFHARDRTNSPSDKKQSKSVHRRAFLGSDDEEDDLDSGDELSAKPNSHHGREYASYNKHSKVMHRRRAFSGSEYDELDSDSDSELSANPKWKSTHVADSRPRGRGKGPSKGLSFGSDDELGLDSDMDDDPGRGFESKLRKPNGNRVARSGGKDPFSGSESENDGTNSYGYRYKQNAGPSRRGRDSKGRGSFKSTRDTKFGPGGMKNDRRSSFNDDDDDLERSTHGRGSFKASRDAKFRSNGVKNHRRNSSKDDGDDLWRSSQGQGRKSRSDTKFRSNGMKNNRRNSFEDDDFGGSSQGSRGRGFRENSFGSRTNSRGGGLKNFDEPRNGGFHKQQGGRRSSFDRDSDERGPNEFKNSRRVIER